MFEKLSLMSVKNFVTVLKIRLLLYYLLEALFIGLYFYFALSKKQYSVGCAMLLIAFIIIMLNQLVMAIILRQRNNILIERLELQKFKSLIETIYSKQLAKGKIKLKKERLDFYLSKAKVLFYQGNFEESLKSLGLLQKNDFLGLNSEIWMLDYYYLLYLNNIFLEKKFSAEKILSEISKINGGEKVQLQKKEYSQEVNALNDIFVLKQNNAFFEILPNRNKLGLVTSIYYSGMNNYFQNEFKKAKENFQKIANENPELFYVREAKKYLEELDNE
ncbi:hypothetical protein [Streptococcus equinus]|uniref:hypothetical protein n=1 Tax=Streptococcus equinus TaxID=1335 RepID=UPI0008897DC1|nr:hypothetical protein [Streptococcus equinus]SDI73302.1 hypothetical protein SAMN05216384_1042 [Streptococcus equinus]SEP83248.1 hypothetical protein SAMN05216477_104158 [Streptococcus equinus]